MQLHGEQTVRAADSAASTRSRAVSFQKPADILALLHPDEPQPWGSRSEGPLMVTVWQ
jgi:hypothetical protein